MSATARTTATAMRLDVGQRFRLIIARVCRCDEDEFVLQAVQPSLVAA